MIQDLISKMDGWMISNLSVVFPNFPLNLQKKKSFVLIDFLWCQS